MKNKIITPVMIFFVSLVLVTSAWGMVDFEDEDNWPWSQTTNLGPDAEVPGFFINLGITGARAKITETNLRALKVAYVFSNTPAHGKLQVGDLIVGANGKAFETDHKNGYGMAVFGGDGPCMDFGYALEESQGNNGILTLNVRRNNQDMTVELDIGTKYGKYSDTFPYNCPKTELILDELYTFIASKHIKDSGHSTWGYWGRYMIDVNFLAAMALLASGDPQYLPKVKQTAQFFADITDSNIEDEMEGLTVWNYSFAGILLSEYYLVTGEAWVLPELEEIKTWLLDAQFTDISQQLVNTHGEADERQIGGWGHDPAYSGYGPFNMQTGQCLVAFSLMSRCGISVPWDRMEIGYQSIATGTAQNGYVWYSYGLGGGPTDYADMGRTGVSAVANYLVPSSDSTFQQMAKLNAQCIGYDGRYKSFPDTHGSPHLGMVWIAMGARLDNQGFRNLMDYHRWWYSLAQTHDGNQFVGQPSRDAGGQYDTHTRVIASSVAALVLSTKNKTLHVIGKNTTDEGSIHTYSLSVHSGSGDGSYEAGARVPISADPSPSGQVFDRWVVIPTSTVIDNVASVTTTLTMPSSSVTVTATYKYPNAGTITREVWTGVSGTSIAALTGLASYPDNPDSTDEVTSFEAPTNCADNYGTRIVGYLHAPVSGSYTFWIASDDNGELWLSTDESATHKQRIAYVPDWTSSREWTKFTEQRSGSITLTAGQRYYIEAIQKEGAGGDNLAVAWQRPAGDQEVIPGTYLSPYDDIPDGSIVGDLNDDGTVNILDLQLCVNVIMEHEPDPDIVAQRDVNNDGVVNITDIQMIVNIISNN
ncbi:MAG: DUF6288 domain-containing protein [bacterium]